ATLKLVLQTAHRNRLASSVAIDTYTAPSKHVMASHISAELEGHKGLLDSLRTQGAEGKDAETEPDIDKSDLEVAVSFIRLESCYDTQKVKVIAGTPSWEGRALIQRALKAEAVATHHKGVAPAGWLEDEAGHWLETISDNL
ncbi:unnamed protein product, partial [Prorocentrum cordatum]